MEIHALVIIISVGLGILTLGGREGKSRRSPENYVHYRAFGWFGKHNGNRLQISLSLGRRYLVPPESSLLVVGATRSGKTRRVVLPNARHWSGTLLATSVKTDILEEEMLRHRRQLGDVMILGTSPLTNCQWWPPLDCFDAASAMRIAAGLALSNPMSARATPDTKFWLSLAEPVVTGALRVSARTGDSLGEYLDGELRLSQMVRVAGDIPLPTKSPGLSVLTRDSGVPLWLRHVHSCCRSMRCELGNIEKPLSLIFVPPR